MLYPVVFFGALGVVESIQRANQIAGDAADAVEGHMAEIIGQLHIISVHPDINALRHRAKFLLRTMGPALANGAVGIVASGYEDNGVYFAKGSAGGERTQSGEPAKQSASPTVKPTAKPTEAPKACNYCGGSGWRQHSFCRGSGKTYMAGSGYRSCPSCGGTGRVRCNYCGGTGKK